MTHRFPIRVYYEDTDFAGIVYYANYLKFIERGRTEFVRSVGIDQKALRAEAGIVFAVRHVEADYLKAAYFDDELEVVTSVLELGGARIVMRQEVTRGGEVIFAATVTLVAMHENGKAARLPADIRSNLQ
ncbi:MAG: tol-pal system-associated acyl-CoA thioesterase [Maritimibacter sp.]